MKLPRPRDYFPFLLIACAAFLNRTALCDEADPEKPGSAPAAGHSLHGEAFNEGPRQRARLIPGTGKVELKITSKSHKAQKFFNQGVGQLHGFWYFEAERSFRQVAA